MKANKFFYYHKAFSLVELFITMLIIAIFASFITIDLTSQSQTAKQEAEKLAAFILDLTRKADRRHLDFTIQFESDQVYSYFGSDTGNKTYLLKENPDTTDTIILDPGFSISNNFNNSITYNSNENEFNGTGTGKIIITRDSDQTKYYIIFRFGRVRVSENPDEE